MLDGEDLAVPIIVLTASKVCALAFELAWKCSLTIERGLCDAPEESNGIIERALMVRMLPVFWAGYRVPLEAKHLFNIPNKLLIGQVNPVSEGKSALLVSMPKHHLTLK
jgi:hypothetical protein